MQRFTMMVGILVLGVGAVLVLKPAGAAAKDPTIKEVMDQLHKGMNPPYIKVKRELQAEQPNWDEIQRSTREFVTLGSALARNNPPKGDRESWARLASAYEESARCLDQAAQKKDRAAALAAQSKLAGSCMTCHKAHRG